MIGQLFLRSVICASVIAAVHHLSACLHLQMDCSVARIVAISCGACRDCSMLGLEAFDAGDLKF